MYFDYLKDLLGKLMLSFQFLLVFPKEEDQVVLYFNSQTFCRCCYFFFGSVSSFRGVKNFILFFLEQYKNLNFCQGEKETEERS